MTPRERSVIVVALVAQMVAIGTTIGSFTLFVKPIAEEFDATRFQVSLGISFMTAMLGVGGLFIGSTLDRGRVRTVMLTGACLQAGALVLASLVHQLLVLGGLALVVGFAMPMLGPVTGSALVGKFFHADRGRALGIVNMGAPSGGLVFALIAGLALESLGWRGTYALFAAVTVVTTIPLVLWLVPSPDELLAASPPGEVSPRHSPTPQGNAAILRNRSFICIAIPFGIMIGSLTGWSAHMAPYLDGLGGGTRAISATVAASMGTGMIGTLGFGTLVDRVPARTLAYALLAILTTGYLILSAEPSLALAIATIIGVGICGGGLIPVFVSLLVDRFGAASLGRSMGISNAFVLPFGFSLPPVLGAIYDSQGEYTSAFFLLIGLYAIAAFSLSRIRVEAPVASGVPA